MTVKGLLPAFACALSLFYLPLPTIWLQRSTGFYPERQKTIVRRSTDLAVRLERKPAQLGIALERSGKKVATLSLPQEMAQVDEIEFTANGRIVILGHVNGSVRQAVVVDPVKQALIDRFYCYEPVLSPNKRFLVFVKFFPAHFVEGVTYQYLLYDLKKSPEANRPKNTTVSDPENVGRPLYPLSAKNQFGDNTGQPASEVHMLASGTFFWSADSRRVAFADSHQGVVTLVVVSLIGAEPIARIAGRELRKIEVCKPNRDLNSCAFVVSSVGFTSDGVTVALRASSGKVKDVIEVKYP